jgi:hypothetical protein
VTQLNIQTGIHGQCFHQQTIATTLIAKDFMWIVWKHGSKLGILGIGGGGKVQGARY